MLTAYFDVDVPRVLATKALRPMWKGVIWSPLSPVRVADVPEPALPGPRWVKVRNRQCGIDATDLSLVFVEADPSLSIAALPGNVRAYLGHELVGTVAEVGAAVARFKPGDRVILDRSVLTGLSPNCADQEIEPPCRFCARGDFALCENMSAGVGPRGVGGGWGERFTCHETNLFPCPPDLSDDQAMMVEPMAVALHSVLRHPPRDSDRVLVLGAGSLGLLTIQAVRAVSPHCFLAVGAKYPHQAEAACRFGANEIIGRQDRYAAVARLTGGKHYTLPLNRGMILGGFDVIYDCVGTGDSLTDCLRWTRAQGTVVLVGITFSPIKLDLSPVWHQEVDLIGCRAHGMDEWNGRRRPSFEWVVDLIHEGKFRVDGLITHRFPLSEYKRAIATSVDKTGAKAIKVMFQMT